jgi:hypothetical protein
MILFHNLNAMMKKLAMKGYWLPKRMKAVRFSFINLAGRVVKGSLSLIIRLTKNNPSLELLIDNSFYAVNFLHSFLFQI